MVQADSEDGRGGWVEWLRSRTLVRPGVLVAVVVALGLGAYQVGFSLIDLIELKTYDLRVAARATRTPSPVVALAVIDEESLEREGRWPWPRSKMAALLEALSNDGAKVVAFDIGFLEPDGNSRAVWVDELAAAAESAGLDEPSLAGLLRSQRERADHDEVLAAAIREGSAAVVLGYFFHMSREEAGFEISTAAIEEQRARIAPAKYPIVLQSDPDLDPQPFLEAYAPEANLPVLSDAAAGAGFFSLRSDRDGTIRWMPLAIRSGEEVYPPLSVAAVWHYLDQPPLVARVGRYGVDGIQLGDTMVPTDASGQLLIDYLGPPGSVPSISATRILVGDFAPGTFDDRIVLVGTTATGTYDLRTTPVGPVFPGPEIHATVIDNLLGGSFLTRPGWAQIYDLVSIALLGALAGLAALRTRALVGLTTAMALGAAHVLSAQLLLERYGVWVNVMYPLLALSVSYVALTLYSFVGEQRERRRVTGTFGRYVAPAVVDDMLKDPDGVQLGGEEKVLTVLFSDLQGFTSYTERYGAKEMIGILSDYYAAMTEEIFSFEGTLKEYVGDELMAIFGAPVDQADHAARACRAALAMRERRRALGEEWAQIGRPRLFARTGINSGSMLVGNLGSRYRFSYGVLGDDVNLGSRLEGLNKIYGTEILVGENAAALVGDEFSLRELDLVRVVGKDRPVRVYELLGSSADELPADQTEAFAAFATALEAYRQMRWDEAAGLFKECIALRPQDGPAAVMIERCQRFAQERPPDEDWDGVFEATSK